MSIETPVIEAEPTIAPIVDPKESTMAKAFAEKYFAPEPAKEEVKTEPVVTDKKVEPVVENKSEPVAKTAPVVDNKSKSKTALEFDNQRKEWEEKVTKTATERDELKARAFDLENELVKLREAASTTADYSEIKKKNDELIKIVDRLDVQENPSFKLKYNAQEEYLLKQVGDILEGVESKDKIIAALKMAPGSQKDATLDELQQDLGITKIAKIANYVSRLEEISKNKEFEISNAAIAKRLYQEEQDQLATQNKKIQEQIFNKFANNISETDVTFKKREGDDAFNQNIDSRLNEARRLYHEASPEELAQAMLAAVDRPILLSLIQKLSEELTTATGALNGKLQATPGVSASRKDEPTKPTSFVDTIAQAYK